MKQKSKLLVLTLILSLCMGFIQIGVYADNTNNYRTDNIISASCNLSINSSGKAKISAICDARDGKTIYGKVILKRKTYNGWSNVKTFEKIGYGGELYIDKKYQLNKKGTYKLKFIMSCDGETYSFYSKTKKYN